MDTFWTIDDTNTVAQIWPTPSRTRWWTPTKAPVRTAWPPWAWATFLLRRPSPRKRPWCTGRSIPLLHRCGYERNGTDVDREQPELQGGDEGVHARSAVLRQPVRSDAPDQQGAHRWFREPKVYKDASLSWGALAKLVLFVGQSTRSDSAITSISKTPSGTYDPSDLGASNEFDLETIDADAVYEFLRLKINATPATTNDKETKSASYSMFSTLALYGDAPQFRICRREQARARTTRTPTTTTGCWLAPP